MPPNSEMCCEFNGTFCNNTNMFDDFVETSEVVFQLVLQNH